MRVKDALTTHISVPGFSGMFFWDILHCWCVLQGFVQGLPLQVETHLEQIEQFSPRSLLTNWVNSSPNRETL